MVKSENLKFYQMVRDFLTIYLPKQKASSANTIKAYRESLNLLLEYLKEKENLPLMDVSFDRISRKTVEGYLDWLEETRKCSISTRNHRLSSIRSFYKYAGNRDLSVTAYTLELVKIPIKRSQKTQQVKFFEEDALKAILAQPDTGTRKGTRDLFFMILMYDTAGRNQEVLNLKVSDIRVSTKDSHAVLTGKGNKIRIVPLMQRTIDHYNNYIRLFHGGKVTDEFLFYVIQKGKRQEMSADNVEKFMKHYGLIARVQCNKVPEGLHPHMFRHSRSMHLYRGGMPLALLSEWLGHAQLETTKIYANADTQMKRKAIEKATSSLNPLTQEQKVTSWQNDEELIKRLYGLL
jgi:integrase/recombinase XerD